MTDRDASDHELLTYAQRVAETYTEWANGECYGYILHDADGHEIDSCWGFIGRDAVVAEAQEAAHACVRRAATGGSH